MKYLLLSAVLCYAYAASIDESKNLLKKELQVFGKCMAEGNVTESAVESIFKKGEVPETNQIKCLLACHMKGMGYLSDDGKMDWKKLDEINKIEYVDPEHVKKALEVDAVCSKKVPQNLANACEVGYAVTKCFLDEAKKRNLPIIGPESAQ
uniref:Odorant-binding protein 7 n=1 Tax=Eocanthecona furcellata TaxID=696902 RepID=A0AAT9TYW6_9HEMI